jgi:hypothetical protein
VVGIAGRNLIIGDKGWFLEGSTGSDEEMYGDLAVPLEMDDEVRGEFTEWLLYRDGEVVTTVTDDQIDIDNDALLGVSTSTLSNPIGANVRTSACSRVAAFLHTLKPSMCPGAMHLAIEVQALIATLLPAPSTQSRTFLFFFLFTPLFLVRWLLLAHFYQLQTLNPKL